MVMEPEEPQKEALTPQDEIIKTNIFLFFQNIQLFSRQQFTNCYIFAETIFTLFEDSEKKKILNELYFDPMGYFRKKRPEFCIPKNVAGTIAEFEWIYFRDSHFPVRVNRLIPIEGKKTSDLPLAVLIRVLGQVKAEMNRLVSQVCIERNIPLEPDYFVTYSTTKRKLDQVGINE